MERLGISCKSLWTEKEYASYRCCSVSTAQKERHLGKGPIYLKIGHQVRYRPGDVLRYCFERRINHLTK
ncbi:terminase [Deltaproteobacteria bacterium Smac51]|nr:terminase [Deltaproteobacteria bacterium Smac51]